MHQFSILEIKTRCMWNLDVNNSDKECSTKIDLRFMFNQQSQIDNILVAYK
jgi:hypothetical protein